MKVPITNGRPSPRLISNTFEPIAFDTAMSPNPSLATKIELRASCRWRARLVCVTYLGCAINVFVLNFGKTPRVGCLPVYLIAGSMQML